MKKLLVIFLILFSISSTAIALFSLKIKEKKYFFILQNTVCFKMNINELYNPRSYKLILIINEKIVNDLNSSQKKIFDDIIVLKTFNDTTITNAINKILAIKNIKIYDILTQDFTALPIVCKLRQVFKLDSAKFNKINNLLLSFNKKEKLHNNINCPKSLIFSVKQFKKEKDEYLKKIINNLNFPIFMRPFRRITPDGAFVGREKIFNLKELRNWAKKPKDDNYELTELIKGDVYQCDSLIKDGKIVFQMVCKTFRPCYEFLIGVPNAAILLPANDKISLNIGNFNATTLKSVSSLVGPLPNGAVHLEVIRKPSGKLVFLNLELRTPGSMTCEMYKKHSNINIEIAHFKLQMEKDYVPTLSQQRQFSAKVLYPKKKGVVKKLFLPKIKSKFSISQKIKINEKLNNSKGLKDVAISILIWNKNHEELQEDFYYLTNNFKSYYIKG